MLSDRERATLHEIERRFLVEDPDFVRFFRTAGQSPPPCDPPDHRRQALPLAITLTVVLRCSSWWQAHRDSVAAARRITERRRQAPPSSTWPHHRGPPGHRRSPERTVAGLRARRHAGATRPPSGGSFQLGMVSAALIRWSSSRCSALRRVRTCSPTLVSSTRTARPSLGSAVRSMSP
ncbi:MAG: hypothetical protein DLM62_08370 [Pseudonocardiales bacterium]|nr:MAG: hypothetical protein DLM62_08370 [Pseudonocardiales bacterium]